MKWMTVFIVGLLTGCATARLSVPETFKERATAMPVEGINGWQVNQKLRFGNFETSPVKRGWDFGSSLHYTKWRMSPEEALLKVFDINTKKGRLQQRSKFQYSIASGSSTAEIFATEKFDEQQLVYKSNNPWIGKVENTRRYEYAFAASILPVAPKAAEPWSLVLINRYDAAKDRGRKIFERAYIEEEGYATNGRQNIAIAPLRTNIVETGKGRQKVAGGNLLSGYEMHLQGAVACMVDILSNTIWMKNDLAADDKLICASIASALLLKRMQDVENDRDTVDR